MHLLHFIWLLWILKDIFAGLLVGHGNIFSYRGNTSFHCLLTCQVHDEKSKIILTVSQTCITYISFCPLVVFIFLFFLWLFLIFYFYYWLSTVWLWCALLWFYLHLSYLGFWFSIIHQNWKICDHDVFK